MSALPARYQAATPEDIQRFAGLVAAELRPGDLVLLAGPLGAGKTTFAQGLGAALGVIERLTSPTFVIAREHQGRVPVVHVDAYRLGSIDELEDLDLEAELDDAVTLIEWGRGIAETLAEDYLVIDIARGAEADDEQRTVTLTGHGARWIGVVEEEQ